MTTAPVLGTSQETDRAFDAGVTGFVLAVLAGLFGLYQYSFLTFTEFVAWSLIAIPTVSFVASLVLADWLGYRDEARLKSQRYAARLNGRTND